MDKTRMDNSKIIIDDPRTSPRPIIHHLIGRMPEFQRKYGLWIINASIGLHAGRNGFERCPERKFEFYSLSHLYDGGGRLWIDGQGERKLNAGSLILITPGTLNRYGGTAELPYVEDSIRFCGPIADGMAEAGILLSGVYELGTVRRLPPIADLASDPGRDAQIRANMLLQNLLAELYFRKREHSQSSRMEELISLIHGDPRHWWTVEELADLASLSCEALRRRVLEYTGMLPKSYVEEFKIRSAAELLLSTDFSVRNIAEQFGYHDVYHFSRRFKIRTGFSPEIYRRHFSPGEKNGSGNADRKRGTAKK